MDFFFATSPCYFALYKIITLATCVYFSELLYLAPLQDCELGGYSVACVSQVPASPMLLVGI